MALIAFLQLINIKWASSWEIAITIAILEIEVNNRGGKPIHMWVLVRCLAAICASFLTSNWFVFPAVPSRNLGSFIWLHESPNPTFGIDFKLLFVFHDSQLQVFLQSARRKQSPGPFLLQIADKCMLYNYSGTSINRSTIKQQENYTYYSVLKFIVLKCEYSLCNLLFNC